MFLKDRANRILTLVINASVFLDQLKMILPYMACICSSLKDRANNKVLGKKSLSLLGMSNTKGLLSRNMRPQLVFIMISLSQGNSSELFEEIFTAETQS